MENVPGMVTIGGGRIKKQILADFKKIGYEADVQILKAADYGVPQIRRRAVFIGNRIGGVNSFPIKTHFDPSTDKDAHVVNQSGNYVTVSDAISDLPPLESGQGEDEMEYPSTPNLSEYQKRAREGSLRLYNHVARMHSDRDRNIFRMLRQGEKMVDLPEPDRPYRWDIFSDKIKKQSWTGQSRAIVAHMQKDGLMYVHPDDKQARTFTPREAARIQSFRDKFRFYGPMTQQFRQIGNAVPPLLSRSIAMSIRSQLKIMTQPVFGYKLVTT
jgi:DNA-cytosine methyltransferase